MDFNRDKILHFEFNISETLFTIESTNRAERVKWYTNENRCYLFIDTLTLLTFEQG